MIMDEGERGKKLQEEQEKRWPPWLKPLLSTRFFTPCKKHTDLHRRECNLYCLDCINGALCSVCLSSDHHDHRTIQIRRSSYHDVIRVSEIQRMVDVSGVQTYVINSARVVFLNERLQPRLAKGVSNTCRICSRGLTDNFRFCSLACKVAGTCNESRVNKTEKRRTDLPDSEEPYMRAAQQSFGPSTPLPAAKRRKGVPHRSPFGSLITIA